MLDVLNRLLQTGAVSDIDLHFARFLAQHGAGDAPTVQLAACLASHATGDGHVCVDLPAVAGQVLFTGENHPGLMAPALSEWRSDLRRSPVVGRPGEFRPLILDRRGRLYLYRYWDYERRLARDLLSRAAAPVDGLDQSRLRSDLDRLFGPPGATVNGQKVAAAAALCRRFCVISGGPGTGKTTTVVKVLALLAGQQPGRAPVIGLAAPTGKAAARMQEAIRHARDRLDLDPQVLDTIPDQAQTLHRLLGPRPDGNGFRHDHSNPLPLDVLIVDEASMIDLALMARLIDALPSATRLILLGDRDQLASVEAGAVLGDICGAGNAFSAAFRDQLVQLTGEALPTARARRSPLADCIVLLRHSYRFGHDSGIGRLAQAVNGGRAEAAVKLLHRGEWPDVHWRELTGAALSEGLALRLAEGYGPYLRLLAGGASVKQVFAAFEAFRVLCALRGGPFGVSQLNRLIQRILQQRRLLRVGNAVWYPGRPIMVTRNDYSLRLYNGDTGIAMTDDEGRLRVWFQGADGSPRGLLPGRLPPHETVFAMTIHKSQGSEFERVMLVLPPGDSRILGRELLYTGITRARRRVELWASEAAVRAAVAQRSQRSSGLAEALWRHSGDAAT